MKRIMCLLMAFLSIFILISCSSKTPETSNSSSSHDSSNVSNNSSSSMLESSLHTSSSAVSSSSSSTASNDESSETSRPNDDSSSETSSAPIKDVIGKKAKPYISIINSGNYMLKIEETRMVGGEAMPYTTTSYHKGNSIYALIDESYGATSEILIVDNTFVYLLDSFNKIAIKSPYTTDAFTEKVLFSGKISMTASGTEKVFDTPYDYESYRDEKGFEFTLYFQPNTGVLKRYKYYDTARKDTIIISIDISSDISAGIFKVPDNYTVS
ncbi:MAG: hypothetical protein RR057_01145 [Clostridia bacterium]